MTARAGALDELLASGALQDATGTTKDPIAAELERLSSASDVGGHAGQAEVRSRPGADCPGRCRRTCSTSRCSCGAARGDGREARGRGTGGNTKPPAAAPQAPAATDGDNAS